jgi:hypothetical protein
VTTETITVTAEHIAGGKPQASCDCPIALAILAAHPEAEEVFVGIDEVLLAPTAGTELKADLPDVAQEWIAAYDIGKDVQPFEFELTWYPDAEAAA